MGREKKKVEQNHDIWTKIQKTITTKLYTNDNGNDAI